MVHITIGLLIVYFEIAALVLCEIERYNGNWCFDPIENYRDWTKLYFPTVLVLTILLNIIFAPYAVIYWLVKFLKFMTTVGRN